MRLRICPGSDDLIAYDFEGKRQQRNEPAAKFALTLPDGTKLRVDVEYAPPGEYGWAFDVHLPEGTTLDGITWWSDEEGD